MAEIKELHGKGSLPAPFDFIHADYGRLRGKRWQSTSGGRLHVLFGNEASRSGVRRSAGV